MKGSRAVAVLSVLLTIAVVVIGVLVWKQRSGTDGGLTITSFDECVAAGNPVMESDPRQCRTTDGRTFTEVKPSPSPSASEEPNEPDAPLVSAKGVTVHIDAPTLDDLVTNGFMVRGRVPGSWSFEASFGIDVLDAERNLIGGGVATIEGDWMTEELVSFTAPLEFTAPTTETGTIVLHKANPSGLPEHDDQISLPVRFGP